MHIVNKGFADDIIAGKYPGDCIVKIVKYQDAVSGADCYGLIFQGESLDKYCASENIRNPMTYWEVGDEQLARDLGLEE